MEDDGLFVHLMWLHRVVGGDSGALVVPFMRVGTYPTRHLATLRESELLPALGFSDYTNPFGLAVACVFIKQSKPPCHCNLLTPFLMKCAGIPYT